MFKQIKKRDGRIVEFDPKRILRAIERAGIATGEFNGNGESEPEQENIEEFHFANGSKYYNNKEKYESKLKKEKMIKN